MLTVMLGVLLIMSIVGLGTVGAVGVKRLQRVSCVADDAPLRVVLIVSDAANTIEGLVRMLMWRTSGANRDREIIVLDVDPSGETCAIVGQLSREYDGLDYRFVHSDTELSAELQRTSLQSSPMGMVYDLRSATALRDLTRQLSHRLQ